MRIVSKLIFLAVLVSGVWLGAQEFRASVAGRVSDPAGASVAGVVIQVKSVATGVVTPTTSDGEGRYQVLFLNPGTVRAYGGEAGISTQRAAGFEFAGSGASHARPEASGGRSDAEHDRGGQRGGGGVGISGPGIDGGKPPGGIDAVARTQYLRVGVDHAWRRGDRRSHAFAAVRHSGVLGHLR